MFTGFAKAPQPQTPWRIATEPAIAHTFLVVLTLPCTSQLRTSVFPSIRSTFRRSTCQRKKYTIDSNEVQGQWQWDAAAISVGRCTRIFCILIVFNGNRVMKMTPRSHSQCLVGRRYQNYFKKTTFPSCSQAESPSLVRIPSLQQRYDS